MQKLLVGRIAGMAATLLAVSAFVFYALSVLPGDPAAIALGTSLRPDTLVALQKEMGLDQPVWLRFGHWLTGVLTGDFGTSITYHTPVGQMVAARLAVTLPLACLSLVIAMAIALPLGMLAARGSRLAEGGATLLAQLGIALPNFFIGLLLILLFTRTGGLPSGGFPGWEAGLYSAFAALILPATALALPQAAVLVRVTRAAFLEILAGDYIRTARAKGLGETAILVRHAAGHALVPVLTIIGLQFSFLVAGAILVENVFVLPGLGQLAFQALAQRDIPVLQACILIFASLVILVNFLVDLAALLIDPRLRQ
ncbi:ABC transporter permease [Aureimonas fodinaquatilis]|uniref:ABC transporter permease n=1 Tax=Aureimonas fodinaquatilis TaxID=2565783 RepID=A0A5B0DY26_9HYPH|nr:ABC transporter permease [Aureimonas fodinaquatilis]KAA0970912.1 ABC transporter permease [Aureimonas fodinaquatilis]